MIIIIENRHIAFVSTLSPTTGESHSFTPKKEKLSASAYQGTNINNNNHYINIKEKKTPRKKRINKMKKERKQMINVLNTGHYILVYGYNNTSDEFEYCDPTHTHGYLTFY